MRDTSENSALMDIRRRNNDRQVPKLSECYDDFELGQASSEFEDPKYGLLVDAIFKLKHVSGSASNFEELRTQSSDEVRASLQLYRNAAISLASLVLANAKYVGHKLRRERVKSRSWRLGLKGAFKLVRPFNMVDKSVITNVIKIISATRGFDPSLDAEKQFLKWVLSGSPKQHSFPNDLSSRLSELHSLKEDLHDDIEAINKFLERVDDFYAERQLLS